LPVFNQVMQVGIKVVNFAKSTDLNCRLFKDLCSTENAEHSTLLLYTAVRWLSKRIFILRNEVKDFLHNQKNENATFLDDLFIACLVLSTDIFEKLNDLNISLQGQGKWVFELQTSIHAFVNKLAVFVMRAKTGNFDLFPHYKEFLATADSEMSFPSVNQELVQYLTNLQANFKERFPELEEVSYQHVQFPFRVDAGACGDLALEVAELQADKPEYLV